MEAVRCGGHDSARLVRQAAGEVTPLNILQQLSSLLPFAAFNVCRNMRKRFVESHL